MIRFGRRLKLDVLVLAIAAVAIAGPWGTTTDRMQPATTIPGVPGDPIRGERLFTRLDCIRCHSEPRTGRGINVPPPLSVAGSRAHPAWMADYMLDPHPLRYRDEDLLPDLRMPRAAVSRSDAVDLSAYLAGQIDTTLAPAWWPPAAPLAAESLAAEGATLFELYQCLGCHELGGEGKRVGPALDDVGERRQAGYLRSLLLDPQHVVPGTAMKDLDLWDEEADGIVAFLLTLKRESRAE